MRRVKYERMVVLQASGSRRSFAAHNGSPTDHAELTRGQPEENIRETPVEQRQTPAQEQQSQHLGGINLNPALLDLQIKRDGKGIPLPINQQPIGNMKIEGFIPVIINVTPVNLPMILGVSSQQAPPDSPPAQQSRRFPSKESMDLSYASSLP